MTKELRTYWEDRTFENVYASLPAVGDITWGLELNKYWYQEQIDQLEKLEKDWKDKKILDAGCGIGFFSRYFDAGGSKTIGIDFSNNMINIARQNAPNSDFVQGSLIHLPFDDEIFDFIYTSSVFIHIVDDKEWEMAVSELKRCLKKEGELIFIQEFRDFYPKDNEIDYCRLRNEIQYQRVLKMKKIYDGEFLFFIQHFGPYLRRIYKICIKSLYFLDRYLNFGRERIIVYKK